LRAIKYCILLLIITAHIQYYLLEQLSSWYQQMWIVDSSNEEINVRDIW
jgi:hypothetical protein